MTNGEGFKTVMLDPTIKALFLAEPPGWTRLEPQSVSGDPTPGLEARVHDPLWLLARQWQLGEFEGEDVGSPAFVTVDRTVAPVVAFQPGDAGAAQPVRAWRASDQVEPMVEREATPAHGSGLRARAEAGAQLVADLKAAGVDETAIGRVLDACPLEIPPVGWNDPFDTTLSVLSGLLAGRVPDAEPAATAIGAALAASPPTLPEWLQDVPNPNAVTRALASWFLWYRGSVSPARDPSSDSWIDDRLEYRFSLGVASPDGQRVLRAPRFSGGRADWYDFDHDADAPELQGPDVTNPGVTSRSTTVWASPLRFGGMPAERYWEFEDGLVNLGSLQVQPHDIARLALVEFAMVYGNDWISIPLDVPYGSFVSVDSVRCTNTFGEEITVPVIDDSGRSGRFRMFEISASAGDSTLRGLFVPPAAPTVFEGQFLEEVLYLRDEMANMVWAVERVVQGPSGDPRSRLDEPRPAPFEPGTDPGADMDYVLESEVPDWWIPFIPVSTGFAAIALRKGAMVKHGERVQPRGVLLRPNEAITLPDEEVPREGVRLRRVPTLARAIDGSYARWIGRRVMVGRGEGASGLAFDSAVRRRPETD